MENPYGFTTGFGQPFGLTTYPRASRAVDFAGPDGQPLQVAHRSLDNARALPTKPTAVLLIFSLHFHSALAIRRLTGSHGSTAPEPLEEIASTLPRASSSPHSGHARDGHGPRPNSPR